MVALALMMTLTMLDFLSNAMLNADLPAGDRRVHGTVAVSPEGDHSEAEEALAVASEFTGEGRMVEAGQEFHRAIELTSVAGDRRPGGSRPRRSTGSATRSWRPADRRGGGGLPRGAGHPRLRSRPNSPDDDHFRDLAIARDSLSRALAESGRTSEAIEERQLALRSGKSSRSTIPGISNIGTTG